MCHLSAGTCLHTQLWYTVDEHVTHILTNAGSDFWRLAPACVSHRSLIQSQMASGIRRPSLPCSSWLLPKRWWSAITWFKHPSGLSQQLAAVKYFYVLPIPATEAQYKGLIIFGIKTEKWYHSCGWERQTNNCVAIMTHGGCCLVIPLRFIVF